MSPKSSKHHFIPQYYINGFSDSYNLLYIYDKTRDKIKNGQKGSGGVFFELDRNTLNIDNTDNSILEEELFSKIDDELSKRMRKFCVLPFQDIKDKDSSDIFLFLIDLFWRNPLNDETFREMWTRSSITIHDRKSGEILNDPSQVAFLMNDPIHKKMERSKMTLTAFEEILKNKKKGGKDNRIIDMKNEIFVLGDYPILFEKNPENQTELITLDFLIPLNSKRMFSSRTEDLVFFDYDDAMIYNALIIDQSQTTICSANKQVLDESIRLYKHLIENDLIDTYRKRLFNKH